MDVTIPFEGEVGSLEEARRTKEHKYASLKSWLETQYTEVSVDAFIIGALGSWDPCNEPVLKKLGIGRNYAKLFRKLCATTAMEGTHKLWIAFSTSHSR